MARAATRQNVNVAKLVFIHELRAFDILMPLVVVALTPTRGRPFHIEHFLPRPNELLRVAVTLETPFHIQ